MCGQGMDVFESKPDLISIPTISTHQNKSKPDQAFEEGLTFWAPDGSGKVLTWAEFQKLAAGAPEGLPHPKVGPLESLGCGGGLRVLYADDDRADSIYPNDVQELLKQLEEENARWVAKGGQRRAGVGANSR